MFLKKMIFRLNPQKIFILLLFCFATIFSQVNPNVAFYPLHVGDTWQYAVEEKIVGGVEVSHRYVTAQIAGREIIDGKQYYLLSDGEMDCYRRLLIDSTDATVWEYKDGIDCLIDSLSMTDVNDVSEAFGSKVILVKLFSMI